MRALYRWAKKSLLQLRPLRSTVLTDRAQCRKVFRVLVAFFSCRCAIICWFFRLSSDPWTRFDFSERPRVAGKSPYFEMAPRQAHKSLPLGHQPLKRLLLLVFPARESNKTPIPRRPARSRPEWSIPLQGGADAGAAQDRVPSPVAIDAAASFPDVLGRLGRGVC